MRNFKIKLVVGCSAMVLALGAGQAFAQETTAVSGTNNAGGGTTAATATGMYGTAIGSGASSNGTYGTAVGAESAADGSHGIALGHAAQASGQYSVQIGGHGAASGNYSTVVGNMSSASGAQSSVLGATASASGQNSVALGYGSTATEDNTVSVGSSGAQRRVTNLADGVNASDAATLGQVQTATNGLLGTANAYADSLVDAASAYADIAVTQALATSRSYTDTKSAATLSEAKAYTDWKVDGFTSQFQNRLDNVSARLDGVGAMSSAMSMMAGNSAGAAAGLPNRISMAVGGYRGQAAIAAGYTHNSRAISVNVGVSATGRDVMSGGSVGFAW